MRNSGSIRVACSSVKSGPSSDESCTRSMELWMHRLDKVIMLFTLHQDISFAIGYQHGVVVDNNESASRTIIDCDNEETIKPKEQQQIRRQLGHFKSKRKGKLCFAFCIPSTVHSFIPVVRLFVVVAFLFHTMNHRSRGRSHSNFCLAFDNNSLFTNKVSTTSLLPSSRGSIQCQSQRQPQQQQQQQQRQRQQYQKQQSKYKKSSKIWATSGRNPSTITDDRPSSSTGTNGNSFHEVAARAGASALHQVQWLGSRVATADKFGASEMLRIQQENRVNSRYGKSRTKLQTDKVYGTGGSTFASNWKELFDDTSVDNDDDDNDGIHIDDDDRHYQINSKTYQPKVGDDHVHNSETVVPEWDDGRMFHKNNAIYLKKIPPPQGSGSGSGSGTTTATTTTTTTTTTKRTSMTRSDAASMSGTNTKGRQVWEALSKLEANMQLLDRLAGQKPQLSVLEFALLTTSVGTCICGPILFGGKLASFIAPSAAAFAAAIGVGAEYTGKVAVADGKEVAAASIQCAAEAEGYLANAERAKAITPLCVGIGATAATLALLVPVLLDAVVSTSSAASSAAASATGAAAATVASELSLATEIYLCCPLVGVLAAAVAGLALQDVKSICSMAIGVGNRRFARSGLVGRTWLSSTEVIDNKSKIAVIKWRAFSLSVLPAPIIGVLVPGTLPTKTIVVAAVAAAQSAYYLAQCEYILGRATDAVALKARSAAVCDTYANQGARSAAILPFTSALSGLCAAATAAIVELPFIEHLSSVGTPSSILLEILAVSTFPAFSALFAAAASVSKARCEVDAEAAMQAASTLALPYSDAKQDPILQPVVGVWELINLTFTNSIRQPFRRFIKRKLSGFRLRTFFKRLFGGGNRQSKNNNNGSALYT